MILECPFDELVEDVASQKLVDISAGEVCSERLGKHDMSERHMRLERSIDTATYHHLVYNTPVIPEHCRYKAPTEGFGVDT